MYFVLAELSGKLLIAHHLFTVSKFVCKVCLTTVGYLWDLYRVELSAYTSIPQPDTVIGRSLI